MILVVPQGARAFGSAVLYLARKPNWNARRRVLLANVLSSWTDDEGQEQQTNLFAELEVLVDRFQSELDGRNRALPAGRGLADFPEVAAHQADQDEP